ncbi:hypothetical protein [Streptomyces sp. NBU3104]|nr:hypothetical protein [Streptomyces sp. NBU3104]UKL07431.1 hypothetical protein L2I08_30785 [Streptomyces sp. NBU3104]
MSADDPDYNPICACLHVPKQWCEGCGGCVVCGQCREPHVWPPLSN